ncbi:MAG TPA: hypothetical protein VL400_21545, partial [Polyangiaceae bacterium]|nr:hypothetical protein [Polyangiaceae bacterium]
MRPRSSVVAARVGRLAAAGCLVVLASACGDDATRYAGGAAASGGPRAAANGAGAADGGAASVEALFERAQRAVSSGDDLELLRCVRPETREGWLRDLVVDVALESTDQPVDGDVMRARRKEVRRILERHGAKLGARPKTLDTSTLGAALLENVRDHDALFAALL